jgi:hypothetical protein
MLHHAGTLLESNADKHNNIFTNLLQIQDKLDQAIAILHIIDITDNCVWIKDGLLFQHCQKEYEVAQLN